MKTEMTEEQEKKLQLALAKMLPEKLRIAGHPKCQWITWQGMDDDFGDYEDVKDTEWLHICWLVEQVLDDKENYWWALYNTQANFFSVVSTDETVDGYEMFKYINASWQQRALALCKVKGVEV